MQKERKSDAFQEMLAVAKGWLAGRSPEELAELAGAEWEPETKRLSLQSLNQRLELNAGDWSVSPQPENWHYLILLHYLSIADGTPLSDEMTTFGNLKDGLIRGTKFDRTADTALAGFLKGREPEQLKEVCRALGAVFRDSNADLCAVFPFLPRYPVIVKMWFADEEFPASGKMLVSGVADHYLTIEDAVTVGEVMLRRLEETWRRLYMADRLSDPESERTPALRG